MSLQRAALPSTQSFYSIFRHVPIITNRTGRTYHSRLPQTSTYYRQQQTNRRRLSTVTEYRPHSLDSAPPPPRNANIPDTSIAGFSPGLNNDLPPRSIDQHGQSSPSSQQPETQTISETETEAQKSKPVTTPPSTDPSTAPSKRPTKLRPRKAAMSLTPAATSQLHNLLSLPEPKYIRVGVKNRGCSGLAYHLEYVDKAGKFDETVEQDGVKVLIDSKALFSIIGSEMDWVDDKLSQRFVFRNPNISESSPSIDILEREQ